MKPGRWLRWAALAVGPALAVVLAVVGVARAQEGPVVAPVASAPAPADYLLTLGPYGAIVWAAWAVGRGLTLTVRLDLGPEERALLAALGNHREGR